MWTLKLTLVLLLALSILAIIWILSSMESSSAFRDLGMQTQETLRVIEMNITKPFPCIGKWGSCLALGIVQQLLLRHTSTKPRPPIEKHHSSSREDGEIGMVLEAHLQLLRPTTSSIGGHYSQQVSWESIPCSYHCQLGCGTPNRNQGRLNISSLFHVFSNTYLAILVVNQCYLV